MAAARVARLASCGAAHPRVEGVATHVKRWLRARRARRKNGLPLCDPPLKLSGSWTGGCAVSNTRHDHPDRGGP